MPSALALAEANSSSLRIPCACRAASWLILATVGSSSTTGGGGAKTFWILFVILLPWLGVLVYVIARGKGMQERQLDQAKELQAAQAEYIKSVAAAGATPADQISSAKGLLDSGAITQAEFDALKAKALA